MKSIDTFFSKEEQTKLFKALEKKDYLTLEKIINNEEEKAKIIFQLQQEIITINQLESFLPKTFFAEQFKYSQKQEKKIVIQIKDSFLNLINGQDFLKTAISGWHRSNEKKTDAFHFKGFTISKKEDGFVFSREQWFKKLVIKNSHTNTEEKKINKQKNYYTTLDKGSYFIHLDGENFYLELR